MRGNPHRELILYDPEITRTLRQLKKRIQQEKEESEIGTMGDLDTKPLADFVLPTSVSPQGGIRVPIIAGQNYDMKPGVISMVSQNCCFYGLPNEDPYAHLREFSDLCDTLRSNGIPPDTFKLMLFKFTLKDAAKVWEQSTPSSKLDTWEKVSTEFRRRFYPNAKTLRIKKEIRDFQQYDGETLYEAWERFKGLQRACPHHQMDTQELVQNFYNGLFRETRAALDVSAGGTLMKKNRVDAHQLIEEMAMDTFQWATERPILKKPAGIHEVDSTTALAAQVQSLAHQQAEIVALLTKRNLANVSAVQSLCEQCGGKHSSGICPYAQPVEEEVNFVAYQNRNNQYGNDFKQPWNNQKMANPPVTQASVESARIDQLTELMAQMMKVQQGFMVKMETNSNNQAAQIRNLEVQMGQISERLNERPPGTLPSSSEINPRPCMAVTTRSGQNAEKERNRDNRSTDPQEWSTDQHQSTDPTVSRPKIPISQQVSSEKEKNSPTIPERQVPISRTEEVVIPYPERLSMTKQDKQFTKFIEMFRKLHINIPFAEAIAQIPKYAQFLKKVLANKKKFLEYEKVSLPEECSAVIQMKLPPKLKDPGSFTIPLSIGNFNFDNALCDLGASINLMPYSIFKKLGLKKSLIPTTISLELADRSVRHPRGIVEDVLVKVDKFYFPVDFVVLNVEDDGRIPLILGRPFLATSETMIDVKKGEITLRVEDEEVKFDIYRPITNPAKETCCFVDAADDLFRLQELVEDTCIDEPSIVEPQKKPKKKKKAKEKSESVEITFNFVGKPKKLGGYMRFLQRLGATLKWQKRDVMKSKGGRTLHEPP